MKQPIMIVILFATVLGYVEVGWAREARGKDEEAESVLDALRMPYSQKIQTFWRTLHRCVEQAPEFEIAAKVHEFGRAGSKYHGFNYVYDTTLPELMTVALPGRKDSDERPLLEMLLCQALQRKEVSYYAALLAIHAGYGSLRGQSETPPLVDKDKAKWDEKYAGHMRLWLDHFSWWEHAKDRYLRWLFLRLLSKERQGELKVGRGTLLSSDDSMSKYRMLRAELKEGRQVIGFDEEFAVGDAIVEYVEKANPGALAKLPADRETLLIWSAFLVNTDEKELPAVVNGFVRYAEAHKHAPLYADMALALLVVRGYEYDAEKGRYKLTGIGTRLLEYAIEHPIPKLLRVAEVLRDRWDKDALMKLIQKHHAHVNTWDGFRRKVPKPRA